MNTRDRLIEALRRNPKLMWEVAELLEGEPLAGPWQEGPGDPTLGSTHQLIRMGLPEGKMLPGSRAMLAIINVFPDKAFMVVHPNRPGHTSRNCQALQVIDAKNWCDAALQEAGYKIVD